MNLYDDQFSDLHDFAHTDKPSKVLIIASTGRSGSHMLGHSLYKTERFGFPLEYVNPSNLKEWKNRYGINNFQNVLSEIQKRRTSSNGVFSIKIHYPHINQFGGFNALNNYFPNAYFILLVRENILRQAVSLSIARQTGVWIAGQKETKLKAEYNFKDINNCLKETIINNASWRYKLAANNCNYIEIKFKSIYEDLAGSIVSIADFMEINLDSDLIPSEPATQKQENDIKTEWVNKFISDNNLDNELLEKYGKIRSVPTLKKLCKTLNFKSVFS